jgi:molybdate transport system ATP-binding protein
VTVLGLDVRLRRGDFELNVRADLPLQGITSVWGPSGAGKSTLLRIIAGFERPEGAVTCDDDVWVGPGVFVPPHLRRVATVFQDARLFGHLTVAGNLAYAARRGGGDAADAARRFGLEALLTRRPAGLSGGETQRVALARAVLTRPRLLLMDEPLSALDAERRDSILPHLEALRDEGRLPIVHVSHRIGEVARLATRVLRLSGGTVQGMGETASILGDAGDEGPGSVIRARVTGRTEDGLWEVETAAGPVLLTSDAGTVGREIRLFIRGRDVLLALEHPQGISALNILPAVVTEVRAAGPLAADVVLSLSGETLVARVTRRSAGTLGLGPGVACHAILKSVALSQD